MRHRSHSIQIGHAPTLLACIAACQLVTGPLSAATAPSSLSSAHPGVWQDITPAGMNLSPDFPTKDNGYAVQDVLADPLHAGSFFAFACYQGCWKSTDWGTSWAKVSTDGHLDPGRPWGEAIAPDGSYLLACSGYNPQGCGGAWRSTDGGATWISHRIPDPDGYNDPYNFDIDPSNAQHVLASMHGSAIIWESRDGGQTWANRGAPAKNSPYVFVITSTTWLVVGGWGDGPGTWRTTDAGTTWARVSPTERFNGNLPMEHFHGNEQIYVDPISHAIYVPSETGIYRSSDGGASFTQVATQGTSSVFATATTLYAQFAWANNHGATPVLLSSPRANGTVWTPMTGAAPAGMTNGVKRAAVAFNKAAGAWVIISGNWNAGLWRFVEK